MRKVLLVVATTVVWVGCDFAPRYTLTKSGVPTVAKPATCEFVVAASSPGPGYEEIGVLDGENMSGAADAAAFRTTVREQVCSIGGDYVVGQVNGYGTYTRGIVFRKAAATN